VMFSMTTGMPGTPMAARSNSRALRARIAEIAAELDRADPGANL
jgi:hypothetical protein